MIKFVVNEYLLAALVLSFFLLDIGNFLVDRFGVLDFYSSASKLFKGFVQFVFLGLIIIKKWDDKLVILIVAFLCVPLVELLFTYGTAFWVNKDVFVRVIAQSNKYVFATVLCLGIKQFSLATSKAFIIFEWIFYFAAATVIFAAIFDWQLLYTYNANRFGFKPLVASHNELSLFWMIGVCYFGVRLYFSHSKKNLFVFILILIASSLLGTKAIFLFLAGVLILMVFINYRHKLIVILGFVVGIFSLFLITDLWGFFYEVERFGGFFNSLTSLRWGYLMERFPSAIEEWRWYNYLFGGSRGLFYLIEMDLFDLFLFGGLIGFILYFIIISKSIFKFAKGNVFGVFFYFQFIIIGALSGHFYFSGVNAIYLVLLVIFLQSKTGIYKHEAFSKYGLS